MKEKTDKQKALKSYEQIMEQVGKLAVNIDGLITISEALQELPEDWVTVRKRKGSPLLNRIRNADKLLHEPWDYAAYGIYQELCDFNLTDEDLERLINLGVQVYSEQDPSTPTGVAMAIVDLVFPYIEEHYAKIKTITYDDVVKQWMYSDRT